MALPTRLPLEQLQNQWKSQLDPILANPILQGLQLKNVNLINGTTVVNHLLGRTQQGWIITDINGSASVYRSQPFNDKTLTLVSDAAVTASLWVY